IVLGLRFSMPFLISTRQVPHSPLPMQFRTFTTGLSGVSMVPWMATPALRASLRRLDPCGTSISCFSLTKTTLGMESTPCRDGDVGGYCRDCPVAGHQEWHQAARAQQEGAFAVPAAENDTVRLAHFSDVHVTARRPRWRREDWFNKRFAAWFNLRLLGRGSQFRQAERVLLALQD